jgi:hypothetical protein
VRFAIGEERDGLLRVLYVCERAYLPASHGELLYDRPRASWTKTHEQACVQRMAECYVQAQLERREARNHEAEQACDGETQSN